MAQVTFEVYAFDGARWSLQQTFSSAQRDDALEWANELYGQPHVKGVRVMQETFDAASGESTEKSLLTRTKSDAVPKSLNKEIAGPKALDPPGAAKAPKKVAPVAGRPAGTLPPPTRPATPSAAASRTTVEWVRTRGGRTTSLTAASGAVVIGGSLMLLQAPGEAPLLSPLHALAGAHYIVAIAIVLLTTGVAGVGFVLLDAAGERGMLPRTFYVDAGGMPAPAAQSAPSSAKPPKFPAIEIEDDESPPPAVAPGDLPSDAVRLLAYFHDALVGLPRDGVYMKDGKLDAFNWFGCHLFFAGLCDAEARRLAWPAETRRRVIVTAMTAAKTDAKTAARFAARYDDYLTEPRHLAMFTRGADSARLRATGSANAAESLRAALEDWNKKADAAPPTGHVAVMFTDIVGSTEFTQLHGDVKHYEMVQAHDRIVRAALQAFTGREIKHTGDGIMAAFDDATLGVHAAQRVQREIRAHRDVNPDVGMMLRIGLAAGEPIKAGDDLFGSTVQLAARVCALASGDQIVVTGPVREICETIGVTFADLGEQTLKGFKQPVRVHAVS